MPGGIWRPRAGGLAGLCDELRLDALDAFSQPGIAEKGHSISVHGVARPGVASSEHLGL